MPGALHLSAATVIGDVMQALGDAGLVKPTVQVITAGQIAWDQCNMIGVTVTRSWLSDDFPVEATVTPQGQCAATIFGADMILELIRCSPSPDMGGLGPYAEALDATAQQVMADLEVLGQAVPCSLQQQVDAYTLFNYVITQQTVTGPTGGLIATQVMYKVGTLRG